MSRRWMGIVVAFVALSAGALGLPKVAAAQDAVAEWSEPTSPDSPERFALELRFGPYTPDTQDTAFDKVFGGSSLLIAGEFDVAHFTNKAKVDPFVRDAGFESFTFVEAPRPTVRPVATVWPLLALTCENCGLGSVPRSPLYTLT